MSMTLTIVVQLALALVLVLAVAGLLVVVRSPARASEGPAGTARPRREPGEGDPDHGPPTGGTPPDARR